MRYTLSVSRGLQSGRGRTLTFLRETVLVDSAVEGTFLHENEPAEQIGISRPPVREALLLLVADGLVTMVPDGGAHVPPLSGRETSDLMQVCGVLERFAAAAVINEGIAPIDHLREALQPQSQIDATPSPDSPNDRELVTKETSE